MHEFVINKKKKKTSQYANHKSNNKSNKT